MSTAGDPVAFTDRPVARGASRPVLPGGSWLEQVRDDDLRAVPAGGYRPGAQARSLATTRRLLDAAWCAMVQRPAEPLRLKDVLECSGVSSSSFYDRFDGIRSLVEVTGLLLLAHEHPRARGLDGLPELGRGATRPDGDRATVLREVTAELVASVTPPDGVPREVLALGVWSEPYVQERAAHASRWLSGLADRVAAADPGDADPGDADPGDADPGDADPGDAGSADDGPTTYRRALTFVHLADAFLEQTWTIGGLVMPAGSLPAVEVSLARLAHLLFHPLPADRGVGPWSIDPPLEPMEMAALAGHSDRHAATVAEFRDATRRALVADGLDLQVHDLAAATHRSTAAFFDTFGSVGGALADLAAAEQVARIPTRLFRPRPDVAADHLVEHLVWRINAWQDAQGVTGRRLLQIAGRYPEVATVVVNQALASGELLLNWYGESFRLPVPQVRLALVALLALHQHQVLWGAPPPVITGPAGALAALFAPVMADVPG